MSNTYETSVYCDMSPEEINIDSLVLVELKNTHTHVIVCSIEQEKNI
jgi:hypothetical protein